jgi:ferredoxin-NADP reductase
MADIKTATVEEWQTLSSILATFRIRPQDGTPFPDYIPGQYMALRRDNCRLTKKVVGPDGQPHYVTDVDAAGQPKRGPVTHSYSIASAPYETREKGYLEFYLVLEKDEFGERGRLSGSFFDMTVPGDDKITYVNRIVGDFTLDKRANGFKNVVWVGTGTGLAPFLSMVKQLDFQAARGSTDGVRYTLLHTNRTFEELGYHEELLSIEAAHRLDFLYIPTVSRPTARDVADEGLGRGRANNVLRHILGMPTKEEQELQETVARGEDPSRAQADLKRTVAPVLPKHMSGSDLAPRFEPGNTVILTCGNPSLMSDIKYIADAHGTAFEKEDW